MNDSTHNMHDGQQRIVRDLHRVVEDAEALLRHAVDGAGQNYQDARGRLEQSLRSAKSELASAEQALVDRVVDAGVATDRYVRRNPWEAIGVGAGIGLLVGLILGRR